MNALQEWKPNELVSMNKLGDRVQQAQSSVPVNREAGLPNAYIDPTQLIELSASDDPLEAATPISYMEGFPTANGLPIWERLENETIEYFEYFKAYRDNTYQSADPKYPTKKHYKTRSISKLSSYLDIEPKALYALAKMYHWKLRVAAFDAFQEQELEMRRQQQIEEMENHHQQTAKRVFDKCVEFFEQHPEEMTAKSAIEGFKIAAQLHRLSLGLPADKPADDPNNPNNPNSRNNSPTINIMQQIGAGGHSSTDINGSPAHNKEEDLSRLRKIASILQNSGALDTAQSKHKHQNQDPQQDPQQGPNQDQTIDVQAETKDAEED